MNDFNETIFLQESLVKVTNLRTMIGTITYSMSEIKSVNLTMRAKSYRPLLVVPVGLLLITWAMIDETGQFGEFIRDRNRTRIGQEKYISIDRFGLYAEDRGCDEKGSCRQGRYGFQQKSGGS